MQNVLINFTHPDRLTEAITLPMGKFKNGEAHRMDPSTSELHFASLMIIKVVLRAHVLGIKAKHHRHHHHHAF